MSEYAIDLTARLDASELEQDMSRLGSMKPEKVRIDFDNTRLKDVTREIDAALGNGRTVKVEADIGKVEKQLAWLKNTLVDIGVNADLSAIDDAIESLHGNVTVDVAADTTEVDTALKDRLNALKGQLIEVGITGDFIGIDNAIAALSKQDIEVGVTANESDLRKADAKVREVGKGGVTVGVKANMRAVELKMTALKSRLVQLGVKADFSQIDNAIVELKRKPVGVDIKGDVSDILKQLTALKKQKIFVRAEAELGDVRLAVRQLTDESLKGVVRAPAPAQTSGGGGGSNGVGKQSSGGDSGDKVSGALTRLNAAIDGLNNTMRGMSRGSKPTSGKQSGTTGTPPVVAPGAGAAAPKLSPGAMRMMDMIYGWRYNAANMSLDGPFSSDPAGRAAQMASHSLRHSLRTGGPSGEMLRKAFPGIPSASELRDDAALRRAFERVVQGLRNSPPGPIAGLEERLATPVAKPKGMRGWEQGLRDRGINPQMMRSLMTYSIGQIPNGLADVLEAQHDGRRTSGSALLRAGSNILMQGAMGGMVGGLPGAAIGAVTGGVTSALQALTDNITRAATALKEFRAATDAAIKVDMSRRDYGVERGSKAAVKADNIGYFRDEIEKARFEKSFLQGAFKDKIGSGPNAVQRYQEETNRLKAELNDTNSMTNSAKYNALEAEIKAREETARKYVEHLQRIGVLDGRIDSMTDSIKAIEDAQREYAKSLTRAGEALQTERETDAQSQDLRARTINEKRTTEQIASLEYKAKAQTDTARKEYESKVDALAKAIEASKSAKTPIEREQANRAVEEATYQKDRARGKLDASQSAYDTYRGERERRRDVVYGVQDTLETLNRRDTREGAERDIAARTIDETADPTATMEYYRTQIQAYRDEMQAQRERAKSLYTQATGPGVTGKEQDEILSDARKADSAAGFAESMVSLFSGALKGMNLEKPTMPDMSNVTSLASIGLGMGEKDDTSRLNEVETYVRECKAVLEVIKDNTKMISDINAKAG